MKPRGDTKASQESNLICSPWSVPGTGRSSPLVTGSDHLIGNSSDLLVSHSGLMDSICVDLLPPWLVKVGVVLFIPCLLVPMSLVCLGLLAPQVTNTNFPAGSRQATKRLIVLPDFLLRLTGLPILRRESAPADSLIGFRPITVMPCSHRAGNITCVYDFRLAR